MLVDLNGLISVRKVAEGDVEMSDAINKELLWN